MKTSTISSVDIKAMRFGTFSQKCSAFCQKKSKNSGTFSVLVLVPKINFSTIQNRLFLSRKFQIFLTFSTDVKNFGIFFTFLASVKSFGTFRFGFDTLFQSKVRIIFKIFSTVRKSKKSEISGKS